MGSSSCSCHLPNYIQKLKSWTSQPQTPVTSNVKVFRPIQTRLMKKSYWNTATTGDIHYYTLNYLAIQYNSKPMIYKSDRVNLHFRYRGPICQEPDVFNAVIVPWIGDSWELSSPSKAPEPIINISWKENYDVHLDISWYNNNC